MALPSICPDISMEPDFIKYEKAYIYTNTSVLSKDLTPYYQEQNILDYCHKNNFIIMGRFKDNTNKYDEQIELCNLISKLKLGDLLITYSLSVLSTKAYNLFKIIDFIQAKGAKLLSLDLDVCPHSTLGKMLFGIKAGYIEKEVDDLQNNSELIFTNKLIKINIELQNLSSNKQYKSEDIVNLLHNINTSTNDIIQFQKSFN